jgi:tetratricopeptide (TPR) repeat protein
MIDCSLIRVIDGQLYRIADPIKGSVNEVFGYANKEILSAVSEPLQKYVESSEDDHKLELSRVLFRIGFTLGDREATNKGIRLNSDYIKLLEYSYHQRNYKEAIELGLEAVKYCPDSTTARTFLIKALIQEEKWEAAQLQIDSLYPIDEYRNIYYLQGFLERKKGNITKAILALVDAEKHGRKGFALYREFSHCYLMNGDINNASRYIENALAIQPNNNQVIDMAARIAIKNHDEISAKRYIDQLELLDSSEHYNLRLSTFHLSFGRTSLALEAARNSVSAGGSRFLSGRVQLIKTLTKSRLFNEADTEVSSLNSDFSKSKNDIRIALQCSLDLEKDDVKSAFKILDGFIDKSSIQYKGIKKKCLEKLIKDVSIDYKTRQGYQSELKYLESICDYSLTDIES